VTVCTACGTENEAGRKFCKECGTRLAVACPACGTANAPDSKFCGECGADLRAADGTGAVAIGDVPRAVTERRLVSVLFVDLVGFTPFAERRDAEDVREVLDRYFAAASETVQRHGGAVEKFIGDAVMAVWGAPAAHEDDAERAVRAALEVVRQVGALGRELGLGLQARAGVLTGEAAASVGAVTQGMVTGDIVNSASRLQSAAEPGTVVVGESTYRAAARAIAFEPLEPLTLKGKSEPVTAWRAVRVVSDRGGTGRGKTPEPPFVGRDEELRLVKDLLHATGRDGTSRLLTVSGLAGIGKSRLVWELEKYIDGLAENVYWHLGRCPAYGDGISFWAFGEMVRMRARIADSDDAETARARLSDSLAELVDDEGERQWLEPRLRHLLGLAQAPPGDRDELFGAWRRYVERVAGLGTTVLVFEDLQWADPGLLDFVESLLQWSRASPVLVVALARPELADRRPTWGAGVRSSAAIHLEPLRDQEMTALVDGYVDGMPPDGLARVVSRAEGVPLYAVETVRMLADRGVLEQVGDSYRVVGTLQGELDVPETLHALVAARLDVLAEADRSLVQDAAVLGQTFTLEALAAVSGRTEAELEPRLRSLVRRELLAQDVDPRSPERGQYGFVQGVIREVAYSTLAKPARRHRHLAAARYFESLGDDELAGVVANQYLEAYRAEPAAAEAETVAAAARAWLGRASARALSLGSPEQALSYAEQAVSLATEADLADLLEQAALAATTAGDLHHAGALVGDAVRALRARGDDRRAALLLFEVGRAFIGASEEHAVEALVHEVDETLQDDRGPVRVRLSALLADLATYGGHGDEALRRSEEALVLAEQLDDDEALSDAVGARSLALLNAGRHYESGLLARGRLELARRSGTLAQAAMAASALSVVMWHQDARASLEAQREAVVLSRQGGLRLYELLSQANLAEAAIDVGDWAAAEEALAAASEIRGEGAAEQSILMSMALLAAYRGDVAAADRFLAESEVADIQEGSFPMRTWYLRALATVRLAGGDAEDAYAAALASEELDPAGMNVTTSLWAGVQAAARLRDPVRLERVLAGAHVHQGSWVGQVRRTGSALLHVLTSPDGTLDVGEAVTDVLDGWRAADLPLDHALAVLCFLAVLPPAALPPEHVTTARETLASLGARPFLAQLDAATGLA
jgi:class 3 adenylate cyclase